MKLGKGKEEGNEEEAGSQQLTCDEGPCWHLAVIGACGRQELTQVRR